ncbi:MAG: hypothetical protein ACRDXX_05060 [Stackebrandtia sp.]
MSSAEAEKLDTAAADGDDAAEKLQSEASDDLEDDHVDDDRWRQFAESDKPQAADEPNVAAGRLRRLAGGFGRGFRHEWTIAALCSLALAAGMNWRVLVDPTHAVPQDLGDPLLIAHVIAWTGFALWNNPAGLWHANTFYPESNSYAFTDAFLGYAPAAVIGSGHEAALLRYNILFVLTFALAFFGAYALLRQLGARAAGSAVGAAAFAYAPWKLAQAGHLQVLSVGGVVLALAMLARGHGWSLRHGYRAERTRPGWVVAGWLTAAWQVSIGFGIGIPFGYLLAAVGVVSAVAWLTCGRPRVPWRVVLADGLGASVFAAIAFVLAMPYLQAQRDHPEAGRTLDYVDMFSPTWSSFLISPEESALWGEVHAPAREGMTWPPETTLLIGFTLLALAIAGLVWSSWSRRQRWFLAVGTTVSLALAMGTNFIDGGRWGYALLFEYVPGFDGLRTPGRLVLYTTLLLAILAAGTLTCLADRLDRHAEVARVDPRWRLQVPAPVRAALFLPLALVLAEGYSAADVPKAPEPPAILAQVEDPILVLPSDGSNDTVVQYWTVDGFPRVVNGVAAFTPASQERLRVDSGAFPSAPSVEALRDAGIETVVVVPDRLPGTPWEYLLDLPSADPSVTVTDHGDVVVYEL